MVPVTDHLVVPLAPDTEGGYTVEGLEQGRETEIQRECVYVRFYRRKYEHRERRVTGVVLHTISPVLISVHSLTDQRFG